MLGPQRYADVVESHGRRLHELGPGVVGFDRAGAILALDSLNGIGVAIARGEVVRMAGERPDYTTDVWRCDRIVGEDQDHYCRRSAREAEEFIHSYPDPGDGEVLYVLVISSGAEGLRRAA